MTDVVFTTNRQTVRDFRRTDLNDVIAMWQDPNVAPYMDDAPKTPSDSSEWLNQVIHHNGLAPRVAYNLAITVTGDDTAIGWVGFGPFESDARAGTFGVGYLLARAHWRRGYMSEVLVGVAGHVFDYLSGMRLIAWCYAGNVASARTLEKAGFHLVRKRRHTNANNSDVVCLDYELDSQQFHAGNSVDTNRSCRNTSP